MPEASEITPAAGQLWISRPPFMLIARVLAVDACGPAATVEYELLDDDGSPLSAPVAAVLDSSWWATFRLLVKRQG